MNADALAGRRVLVTRPAAQADGLAQRILAAGGEAVLFPTLEIRPVADASRLRAMLARLDEFGLAIFVSANAARLGMECVRAQRTWPQGLRVAAVGPGSARALRACGVDDLLLPADGYDSEGLLALEELKQVADKRVVIFRGVGGRELLGDVLRARGAQVEYAECYCRCRPQVDPARVIERCARGEIDAVTVTSSEVLRNLWDMFGAQGQVYLRALPLFAPHARIAAAARACGISAVITTAAGDAGLVSAMQAFFARV